LLANGLKDAGVDVEVLTSNTKLKLESKNINGIPITKVPQLGRLNSAPLNVTLPYWIRKLWEKSRYHALLLSQPLGRTFIFMLRLEK
jgi:hypothetical protein